MAQELGLADHIVQTDSLFRYAELRQRRPY